MYRIAARAQEVQLSGLGQALLRIAEDALGLNLGEDAGGATAPIVVEVGADLIVVDPPADGPLFRIQLPALRDRVEKRTGVRLPAVLIRAVRELPRTAFRVSVAGQWPESGQVEPGMVYVRRPSEEVIAALGGACRVVATTDPVSGEASCWATYVRPPIQVLLSDPRKGYTVSGPGDVGEPAPRHGHMGRPARLPARSARTPRNNSPVAPSHRRRHGHNSRAVAPGDGYRLGRPGR